MSSRERDSRSRSRSPRRRKSPSSSRSPPRDRSRSRDRSYDSRDRGRDFRRGSRDRRSREERDRRSKSGERRSVSPTKYKKQRHFGDRQEPDRSRCLGVFNLGRRTTEDEFRRIFERYGKIESCKLVYDQKRDESRGFGFVTFENVDDSAYAKKDASAMDVNGHEIRIDYSITKRAHSPTPGCYMGSKYGRRDGGSRGGRDRGRRSRSRSRRRRSRSRSRERYSRRSPSPYRRRSPSPYSSRRSRSR